MKNIIKVFGVLLVAFGIFVALGSVSASTAELLQPANATTNFESLRVGVAGEGGVTFFNGSVLNESGPFVVADDLRVDGGIWRTEKNGGNPVVISDSFRVDGTAQISGNFSATGDIYAGAIYPETIILHSGSEDRDTIITGNYLSGERLSVNYVDIRPRSSIGSCTSSNEGRITYSNTDNKFYGCDGSAWRALH